MANTVQDAGGLKYVDMLAGRYARKPLPAVFGGGGWTQLRIAMNIKCNNTGASLAATVKFAAGLCSGTTNIPGDATPTNAVGIITQGNPWTYSGVPTQESYSGMSLKTYKNVAGVETIGSNITNGFAMYSSIYTGPSAVAPWFVDIFKGNPNFTVQPFHMSGALTCNMTELQYIAQSLSLTPTATGCAYPTGATVAFSETNGTLDSAFVWFDTASGMRILDWRVIRLA